MLPKNRLPVIITAIRATGGHPWHVTYPEFLKLTPPKISKRRLGGVQSVNVQDTDIYLWILRHLIKNK